MKIGAWIHSSGDAVLTQRIASAAEHGLQSIRSYHLGYAEQAAPALKQTGMSLLAGMHIDAEALVADWRSQVRLDELAAYHDLGITLEAICVGNELREGGDHPDSKRFTARLSFGLANVLHAYREWLASHGYNTPLTYAMEGIVADAEGNFFEWLWPLIDACDIVSLNAYPMGNAAWFTYGAFEESKRFLRDQRVRHDRFVAFEANLRRTLQQLEPLNKSVMFTETGFPSAVGYAIDGQIDGKDRVVPAHDTVRYSAAMREFIGLIQRVDREYNHPIQAIYIYEWLDNFYHSKIWNIEQSPIHTAFGWCDHTGKPKFPIRELIESVQ